MKALIVGSGIGGIATAIRLAKQGYEVDVFEKNQYPGGKLSSINVSDFRFDAGPSLFTMPKYVDELFELTGENPRDYFDYIQLETICNYFWEDGTSLSAFSDKEALAEEIQSQLDIDPSVLQKALLDSQLKYELTGKIFLEQSLHQLRPWLTKKVAIALTRLHKLDIFKTMHEVNKKHLKHPKLIQFFDRFATYNGSNPYKASGILNIIPHFEHHFGAYFPKGGMISITDSLYKLAKRHGVKFKFGHTVDEIIVKNKQAVGLKVNQEIVNGDIIVSNMDINPTYKYLLAKEKPATQVLNYEPSSSALIFYWGINAEFSSLDLHNILFSNDYKAEFDAIDKGEIFHDPTVYINITSKFHPSDAIPDGENWFTMINVPYDSGQNWDKLVQEARINIIKKINKILHTDITPLIVAEAILDPRTIASKTSSFAGALYGSSSNDRMSAFKRHPNFTRKINNLYFCGGSVHPGGGIPLCLLSAKIVSTLVQDKVA